MEEFHSDHETVVAVIDCLPVSAQDRWFHRHPDPDETHLERSKQLLIWLEVERRVAVAVHLHNVAKAHSFAAAPSAKVNSKSDTGSGLQGSTDQGLLSGAMLAQLGDDKSSEVVKTGAAGPVTTAELAR